MILLVTLFEKSEDRSLGEDSCRKRVRGRVGVDGPASGSGVGDRGDGVPFLEVPVWIRSSTEPGTLVLICAADDPVDFSCPRSSPPEGTSSTRTRFLCLSCPPGLLRSDAFSSSMFGDGADGSLRVLRSFRRVYRFCGPRELTELGAKGMGEEGAAEVTIFRFRVKLAGASRETSDEDLLLMSQLSVQQCRLD